MNIYTESYITLFERDLTSLARELSLYEHEADIWMIEGDLKNSAGNLALHLVGNLRHFFGHVIGGGDYKRNRENEFGARDVDREIILSEIDVAIQEVRQALQNLLESELSQIFPINVLGYEMSTAHFIAHLYGHLNYHLGQINYHRRLLGNKPIGWEAD